MIMLIDIVFIAIAFTIAMIEPPIATTAATVINFITWSITKIIISLFLSAFFIVTSPFVVCVCVCVLYLLILYYHNLGCLSSVFLKFLKVFSFVNIEYFCICT